MVNFPICHLWQATCDSREIDFHHPCLRHSLEKNPYHISPGGKKNSHSAGLIDFYITLTFSFTYKDIPLDPQKLSIEVDPLSNWGVRLQNSSTYSPPKWGPPLNRVHQHTAPKKRACLQNSSTKWAMGVRLQISSTKKQSHQPKRQSTSMDLSVQVL